MHFRVSLSVGTFASRPSPGDFYYLERNRLSPKRLRPRRSYAACRPQLGAGGVGGRWRR
jgi:hypothetical protein